MPLDVVVVLCRVLVDAVARMSNETSNIARLGL
jgi:hypothetical protein